MEIVLIRTLGGPEDTVYGLSKGGPRTTSSVVSSGALAERSLIEA